MGRGELCHQPSQRPRVSYNRYVQGVSPDSVTRSISAVMTPVGLLRIQGDVPFIGEVKLINFTDSLSQLKIKRYRILYTENRRH